MPSLPARYSEMPSLPDGSGAQMTQLLFPVAKHMAEICVQGKNKPQTWQRQWAESVWQGNRHSLEQNLLLQSKGNCTWSPVSCPELCKDSAARNLFSWELTGAVGRAREMLQCTSHRFILHPLLSPITEASSGAGPFLSALGQRFFFPFYGKAGWGRKEQWRKRGEGRIPWACSASLGLCPSGEQRQHIRIISQEICSCSHWSSPGKGRLESERGWRSLPVLQEGQWLSGCLLHLSCDLQPIC